MNNTHPYMEMPVWQNLMQFMKLIYAITATFPPEEKEGISRKLRNSATEVPMHFASAFANGISAGSFDDLKKASQGMTEIEMLLYLCSQLGILRTNEFEQYQHELSSISEELHHISSRIKKRST